MRWRGLQLNMRRKQVPEPAQGGMAARNRTAMVVSKDVFYGRAIAKIPRPVLLSHDSPVVDVGLRRELARLLFEERTLARDYNVTSEEATHLLSLAYPLVAARRDAGSVFREWLDAVADVRLPVLELTERQKQVLRGTTVEGAYTEMVMNRDLILHTAGNVSTFRDAPLSSEEATWALSVIMRHSRVVHPHRDVREAQTSRMYLIPLVDLLDVQLSYKAEDSNAFQEEIVLESGKREEEMVVQFARRDMNKGEEVLLWPGRLSNSEMTVRHGISFPSNVVGIGHNISAPSNWSPDPDSKHRREYSKYNCTSLESFELRFSKRGIPARSLLRCYRVAWFLTNGWYTPALLNRLRDLDRWPPPKKYSGSDWLSWTQADSALRDVILEYCQMMRQQLKDTMDAETASDFRGSTDPVDRLIWNMRAEESKTFKECIVVAKKIG
ncbi:unnamed protein product [Prorocentrum cordatum]|nr:unnamed protein product [Polarella glacialis]